MEERSALRALVKSFRITKKNCWKVLKVDLSFWWYYLLQILSIAIGNGSLFLATNGLYGTYLFVLLSFLAQLILAWRCQSKVLTTYGLVFETLCQQTFAPQIIDIPLDTE